MDFWTLDWLKMKLVAALTYKAFQSQQHNIFGTSIMRHWDSQAAVLLPVWSLHLLTVLFMWSVEKWNFLPLFGSKLRWLVEMISCGHCPWAGRQKKSSKAHFAMKWMRWSKKSSCVSYQIRFWYGKYSSELCLRLNWSQGKSSKAATLFSRI